MVNFSRLGARKELGAICHRINEAGLSDTLCKQLIARHLDNLSDTLPAKYQGIIARIVVANEDRDILELVAGVSLLQSLIPATYGSIPAGTVFRFNQHLVTKRKGGVEFPDGTLYAHLAPDYAIKLINGD